MLLRSNAGLVGLVALVAVVVWAGWGATHLDDPIQASAPVAKAVLPVDVPPQPAMVEDRPRVEGVAPVLTDRAGPESGQAVRALPPTPASRDGFEIQNGMPTAVQAPSSNTLAQVAATPGAVDLPPGINPADVAVSPSGIVTVLRTGTSAVQPASGDAVPAANGDASATNPFRPATVTRSL
jgi:hypothetical protein